MGPTRTRQRSRRAFLTVVSTRTRQAGRTATSVLIAPWCAASTSGSALRYSDRTWCARRWRGASCGARVPHWTRRAVGGCPQISRARIAARWARQRRCRPFAAIRACLAGHECCRARCILERATSATLACRAAVQSGTGPFSTADWRRRALQTKGARRAELALRLSFQRLKTARCAARALGTRQWRVGSGRTNAGCARAQGACRARATSHAIRGRGQIGCVAVPPRFAQPRR